MVSQGGYVRTIDHTSERMECRDQQDTPSARHHRMKVSIKATATELRAMIHVNATPPMSEWHKAQVRKVIEDLMAIR